MEDTENKNNNPFMIEKELLQKTLKAYPKLYGALYSQSTDESSSDNKEISMYRLLQVLLSIIDSNKLGRNSLKLYSNTFN